MFSIYSCSHSEKQPPKGGCFHPSKFSKKKQKKKKQYKQHRGSFSNFCIIHPLRDLLNLLPNKMMIHSLRGRTPSQPNPSIPPQPPPPPLASPPSACHSGSSCHLACPPGWAAQPDTAPDASSPLPRALHWPTSSWECQMAAGPGHLALPWCSGARWQRQVAVRQQVPSCSSSADPRCQVSIPERQLSPCWHLVHARWQDSALPCWQVPRARGLLAQCQLASNDASWQISAAHRWQKSAHRRW